MSKKNEISQQLLDEFVNLIREMVREEIKQYNAKQETHYDGLVLLINGDGTIKASCGNTTLDNLPNKTGEGLATGNGVRIYATSILMTDAYVGVKIT